MEPVVLVLLFVLCLFVASENLGLDRAARALAWVLALAIVAVPAAFGQALWAWAEYEGSLVAERLPAIVDAVVPSLASTNTTP